MLIPFLHDINLARFTASAFSLYVKGFGSRSVYFNGPIGTILHACYLYCSFRPALFKINKASVYISLTDAQHRKSIYLNKTTPTIDLRYQRKYAIRSLFTISAVTCTLQAIEAAIKLRKHLLAFKDNKWLHILAAGFQVAAGIRLGKACAESTFRIIIWGSDHCVVTRTAILANESRQEHHLLPHGPSIGKGNIARDRGLFDQIYALNVFQKAVFLKWEPTLAIKLLENILDGPASAPKSVENKPFFLFLSQLDLGLKRNRFSPELEQFLSILNPAELLGIVAKDQKQLNKFCSRLKPPKQFIGLEDFVSSYPPGTAVCAVFCSGVSMDLMIAGYDLALSSNNSLVEDEKARLLLGIPDPVCWKNKIFYNVRFNVNDLENINAYTIQSTE